MGPDPTRAFKRPDPGTFWPNPTRFVLSQRDKTWKDLGFLGNFFQTQTLLGSKIFEPSPSQQKTEKKVLAPTWPCFGSIIVVLLFHSNLSRWLNNYTGYAASFSTKIKEYCLLSVYGTAVKISTILHSRVNCVFVR